MSKSLGRNKPSKGGKGTSPDLPVSYPVRLNRYIAHSGVCSRREADTLIQRGNIKVNKKIVSEMGYQVQKEDLVYYNNKRIDIEKPAYVLLNKPKDFITTTKDPRGRKTVMDLISKVGESRLYPVGRLDRDTMGLLLFTNDGDLAKKLTHPSHKVQKIYHVHLDKSITESHVSEILNGIDLEDGKTKADTLETLSQDRKELGLEIHIGKNRIVRRIFSHLGYDITKLDRVVFGGLTKKNLPRGKWRHLTPREVSQLKKL